MGQNEPIRRSLPGPPSEIPDKLYFRIGDVARLCEVPAYVLRFWESEFPQLKPNKGGTGQRLYRRRDVEMAIRIKRLLYDEGYTIPGARQVFKAEQKQKTPQLSLPGAAVPDIRQLKGLRRELEAIVGILSRPILSQPDGGKTAVHSLRAPRRRTLPALVGTGPSLLQPSLVTAAGADGTADDTPLEPGIARSGSRS